MRLLHRAGPVVALGVLAMACGKDAPSPVDFDNPAAISANLSSVDSAFDTDVFRAFTTATTNLDAANPPPPLPEMATMLQTLHPRLEWSAGRMLLPGLVRAERLQATIPNLNAAAAEGRIIPDTMYGRVFQWDEALDQYTFQDSVVTGLNGVRFLLYATDLGGFIAEPVTEIGTLDIIDESTASTLQLHVLVRGPGGAPTYVDYTASLQVNGQTSVTETATGSISNGLLGANAKELSFDETLTINANGAAIHSTFALNDPSITLMLNESLTFDDAAVVVSVDFRIIQNSQTIRTAGRIVVGDASAVAHITVYVDGHPVASLNGDISETTTQWVDAGGEPLTVEDLAALDGLFDALANFDVAVLGLLLPITVFTGNLI